MIGYRIKEILFGNWRNKGVALFFAVIIWFVAYNAETQREKITVRLVPVPMLQGQVIIRSECQDAQTGSLAPFDGRVSLNVVGPRRQIEKLKSDENLREVLLSVDAGSGTPMEKKTFLLTQGAFPAIPSGVQVNSISPESIQITFDTVEEGEFPVEPAFQRIPGGMEPEPPKIEPAKVTLRGPRSVLRELRVIAEAWLGAADSFEENLPLILRSSEKTFDKSLIDRTVQFLGPSQVKFSVRLRYKSDFFDAEGVRVRFLVPATNFPYRIQFAEETVQVRFQGPVQEIRRLKEKVKEPGFALAVQVPYSGIEGEGTATFTEDRLLLYGFSDQVRIVQHPQRKDQDKGAWAYSIIPIPASPKAGGK